MDAARLGGFDAAFELGSIDLEVLIIITVCGVRRTLTYTLDVAYIVNKLNSKKMSMYGVLFSGVFLNYFCLFLER